MIVIPLPDASGGGILQLPDELAHKPGFDRESFEKELLKTMTAPIPAHGGPTRWVSPPPIHNKSGRVLVAFLDENDDPVWSEVMPALSCNVDYPGSGEMPRMELVFALYSVAK
jgi:hypothetical protein